MWCIQITIGQHRDNSNIQYIRNIVAGKLHKRIGHTSGSGENLQTLCSNVLILTVGSQPISLKFWYPLSMNLTGSQSTCVTNKSISSPVEK